MIKHEYPLLVIKKVGGGETPTKCGVFFFQRLLYDMLFSFSSASCVSIKKPRPVFVQCTRQAGFWPFVKDEAEHMSAFLPVALRLCMTQRQSGPRGQRAEPCWQTPRGNLSFSSQHLPQGLWHFLPQPRLSHFFQKTLHFRPGMPLIPQNEVSRSSLASFPSN